MTEKLNSTDVVKMLKAHHAGAPSKPVPGYFIAELQSPHDSRRADGLYVPLDSQLRGQLWGYEIKVSRADLIVELQDPTKADSWLRYCDRWWLVVSDPAFLSGLAIPEHWGIMTPPSGRSTRLMTIVRQAPKLKPAAQRDAFATIMARLYYGGGDAESTIRWLRTQLANSEDQARAAVAAMQRTEKAMREAGTSTQEEEDIKQVLRAVQSLQYGHVLNGGAVSDEDRAAYNHVHIGKVDPLDVARALLDTALVRREAANLVLRVERIREDFKRNVTSLTENIHAPLEKINEAHERLTAALAPSEETHA